MFPIMTVFSTHFSPRKSNFKKQCSSNNSNKNAFENHQVANSPHFWIHEYILERCLSDISKFLPKLLNLLQIETGLVNTHKM